MTVNNLSGVSQNFDVSKKNQDKVNVTPQNGVKDAVAVDITRETKVNANKELSTATKQFIESKNIDMGKESQNFSSQNVLSQAGSLVQSQSSAVSSYVQQLIA